MRLNCRSCLARVIGLSCALLLLAPALARSAPDDERVRADTSGPGTGYTAGIADTTWVDHDRQPIQRLPEWQPNYWRGRFHQGLIDPVSHVFDIPDKLLWLARALGANTRREAVNVNAFDEVPNSTWFTNRNHMRSVPVTEMRQGPDSAFLPAKPWTITHAKQGGWSVGFQIKDAGGKKWLVKLDSRGYPQLSSGADMVSRTLLHAAGYNVPHNEPVRFRRGEVTIGADLLRGAKGEQFTEADLDSLLAQGAVFPDGSYSASASLFIPGHALGSPSMHRLRPGDSNDWYAHANRRELRGLFVLCAWINDWDTEDHQFLDTFVETRDSLGHVDHYILDVGSSFGAAASGPRQLWTGYENMFDLTWTARRLLTLGFVEEPWRRARQKTGFPSVGNYESEAYRPQDFKQLVPQPAFREMTDRDGYWGAKIVVSFSDAQIAAAVEAAQYEDPRASDYLVRNLILRRDAIARHWFGRVVPLDFFSVQDGALRFCDLAVDVGLTGDRAYDVEIESTDGRGPRDEHVHLNSAQMPLVNLGTGASHLSLSLSVAGNRARPAHVELTRKDSVWSVSRVRHG
jgi:hypothetical protein